MSNKPKVHYSKEKPVVDTSFAEVRVYLLTQCERYIKDYSLTFKVVPDKNGAPNIRSVRAGFDRDIILVTTDPEKVTCKVCSKYLAKKVVEKL